MNDTGRSGSAQRTLFTLEARPALPAPLARLDELAGNLAYAWDRRIRVVFPALDAAMWRACQRNPRLLLRRLPQEVLDQAAKDAGFLELYERAVKALDGLHAAPRSAAIDGHLAADDLVAYFCAEFGIHETLPIYSGGLGVLAGDHCKAASDLGVPLVAVGLLYRQGYFTQTLDAHGRQHAHAHASHFDELPVTLCRDEAGAERRVQVEVGEHPVQLRVWEARVGSVPLVLLDSDVPGNEPAERAITHQLYGGDADMRIRQEIVLGIGGLRALRALGRRPTVFHCNEGHAAFVYLERLREQVAAGVDFASALEGVAASHVFTTHTPVAAGHDVFTHDQLRWHLRALLPQLGAAEEPLLALGSASPERGAHHHDRFNMTTLALRGSRFHNGVSAIHGRVARRMEKALWPQLRTADVPIRHITNGVHLHSFLAGAWARLFDEHLPGWSERLLDAPFWQGIDTIQDERFVATRRELKRKLLADVEARLRQQFHRNGVPESMSTRALRLVSNPDSDALVLGFARRFATYKRATLLLTDPERLARILGDPLRPALLIFAGKAHPRDQPAQALIQQIWQASLKPEFIGRLLVIEGYDLRLACHLVQGCDVWLNNPEYPLEACGTSGQKAGINGAVNVSVLDGWWGEGHESGADGPNGFAVRPTDLRFWSDLASDEAARRERDVEECRQLLDILEHEVAPLYYGGAGGCAYGPGFIRIAKNAMRTLIPRYNSARMVIDYVREFYGPAARHGRRRAADGFAEARALAAWKDKVRAAWPGVRLRVPDAPGAVLHQGQRLPLRAAAQLNGLAPDDVAVECELGRREPGGAFVRQRVLRLASAGALGDEHAFAIELEPLAGAQHYRIRMRPAHAALCHPFELGYVVWA